MKAVVINDEKSAVEYIQTVLTDWKSWHTHHKLLVQALETLLKVNKSKSEDLRSKQMYIDEMKYHADSLRQLVEDLEVVRYGS